MTSFRQVDRAIAYGKKLDQFPFAPKKVYAVARNAIDTAGDLSYTGHSTGCFVMFGATGHTSGKVYPNPVVLPDYPL